MDKLQIITDLQMGSGEVRRRRWKNNSVGFGMDGTTVVRWMDIGCQIGNKAAILLLINTLQLIPFFPFLSITAHRSTVEKTREDTRRLFEVMITRVPRK